MLEPSKSKERQRQHSNGCGPHCPAKQRRHADVSTSEHPESRGIVREGEPRHVSTCRVTFHVRFPTPLTFFRDISTRGHRRWACELFLAGKDCTTSISSVSYAATLPTPTLSTWEKTVRNGDRRSTCSARSQAHGDTSLMNTSFVVLRSSLALEHVIACLNLPLIPITIYRPCPCLPFVRKDLY